MSCRNLFPFERKKFFSVRFLKLSVHISELLDDTLTIEIKISWWIMETKENGAAKVENSDKRFHVWKAEIRRGR